MQLGKFIKRIPFVYLALLLLGLFLLPTKLVSTLYWMPVPGVAFSTQPTNQFLASRLALSVARAAGCDYFEPFEGANLFSCYIGDDVYDIETYPSHAERENRKRSILEDPSVTPAKEKDQEENCKVTGLYYDVYAYHAKPEDMIRFPGKLHCNNARRHN